MAASIVSRGDKARQSPRIQAREWARLWSGKLTPRQATVLRELAEWVQADGVCRPMIRGVVKRLPCSEGSYRVAVSELRTLNLLGTVRTAAPKRRAEYRLNIEHVTSRNMSDAERVTSRNANVLRNPRAHAHVPSLPLRYQSDNQSEEQSCKPPSSSLNPIDDDLDIHQQFPEMLRVLGEQAGIKNPWLAKHQRWAEELVEAHHEGTQLSADVELAIREAASRIMQHGGESWEYMLRATESVMAQMPADAGPSRRESYY